MIEEFRLPDLGEGLPESEIVAVAGRRGRYRHAQPDHRRGRDGQGHRRAALAVRRRGRGAARSSRATSSRSARSLIAFEVGGRTPRPPAPEAAARRSSATAERATPRPRRDPEPRRLRRRPRVPPGARSVEPARSRHPASPAPPTPRCSRPRRTTCSHAPEIGRCADRAPRSTPPVRKLAKDLGVDLALITGTGEIGLITRADVEAYAERVGSAAASRPPQSPTSAVSLVAGGARRRASRETPHPDQGRAQVHRRGDGALSAFTAPHVTTFLTVDVTATMELLASLKADRALAGPAHRHPAPSPRRPSASRCARTPGLNSRWDDAAGRSSSPLRQPRHRGRDRARPHRARTSRTPIS